MVDPKRCPLCGEPNQCGVAQGLSSCWCFEVRIPDFVLARIPREARQFACVCKPCGTLQRNPPDALIRLRRILRNRG